MTKILYKKRNKVPKIYSQRNHAKMRAKERYNLSLNRYDLNELSELIKSDKAICLKKQSNRIHIYNLDYKGSNIIVAYDHVRRTVVTFLPKEIE